MALLAPEAVGERYTVTMEHNCGVFYYGIVSACVICNVISCCGY